MQLQALTQGDSFSRFSLQTVWVDTELLTEGTQLRQKGWTLQIPELAVYVWKQPRKVLNTLITQINSLREGIRILVNYGRLFTISAYPKHRKSISPMHRGFSIIHTSIKLWGEVAEEQTQPLLVGMFGKKCMPFSAHPRGQPRSAKVRSVKL